MSSFSLRIIWAYEVCNRTCFKWRVIVCRHLAEASLSLILSTNKAQCFILYEAKVMLGRWTLLTCMTSLFIWWNYSCGGQKTTFPRSQGHSYILSLLLAHNCIRILQENQLSNLRKQYLKYRCLHALVNAYTGSLSLHIHLIFPGLYSCDSRSYIWVFVVVPLYSWGKMRGGGERVPQFVILSRRPASLTFHTWRSIDNATG